MSAWSRIHPYPAMLADELADSLASEYVGVGDRVLDPFCGTGRSLMAAREIREVECVGVDVNPLCKLIVDAKCAAPSLSLMRKAASAVDRISVGDWEYEYDFGRRVSWFKKKNLQELSSIVKWLNTWQDIGREERIVIACLLSATVRDVSYCRNNRWKLHRLSEERRKSMNKDARKILANRIRWYISRAECEPGFIRGRVQAFTAGVDETAAVLDRAWGDGTQSDVIITSPPYGDSRTTVQYGGVSSLCLAVLDRVQSLGIRGASATDIDGACLGSGVVRGPIEWESDYGLVTDKKYWHGGESTTRGRIEVYLRDVGVALQHIVNITKRDGTIIMVLGRRRLSGWVLYTDMYVEDCMRRHGWSLHQKIKRRVLGKLVPLRVNTSGQKCEKEQRSARESVKTIGEEHVLVFRRR